MKKGHLALYKYWWLTPPDDYNFMDLGSHKDKDMGNITQVSKLEAPPKGMAEESKLANKYKILEERLMVV